MATTVVPRHEERIAGDFEGYEAVVKDLLASEKLALAKVSFIPWWRPAGGRRYICQVYAGPTGMKHGRPLWVWWSSVFASPEELRKELLGALLLRRRELGARPVES
jgi:hypothetical protein